MPAGHGGGCRFIETSKKSLMVVLSGGSESQSVRSQQAGRRPPGAARMKRTGISGRKFAPRRGRFGCAVGGGGAAGHHRRTATTNTVARSLTTTAPATAADARVGALFKGDLDGGHYWHRRRSCTARDTIPNCDGRRTACRATRRRAAGRCSHPPHRDGSAPYGTWPVESVLRGRTAGTEDGDQDSDVAFGVLRPRLAGRQADRGRGGRGPAVHRPRDGRAGDRHRVSLGHRGPAGLHEHGDGLRRHPAARRLPRLPRWHQR